MPNLAIVHPNQPSGSHPVSVPISEKITWCERFTRIIGRNLPKWAGRMTTKDGQVSLDARLLGWAVGILSIVIAAGLAVVGFGLKEIYRQNGELREQRQMMMNDRQNYINYGIQNNQQLQRIEERLDRMERGPSQNRR